MTDSPDPVPAAEVDPDAGTITVAVTYPVGRAWAVDGCLAAELVGTTRKALTDSEHLRTMQNDGMVSDTEIEVAVYDPHNDRVFRSTVETARPDDQPPADEDFGPGRGTAAGVSPGL